MTPRLSPGALAMARHCGVPDDTKAVRVELRQTGRIRSDPTKKWTKLTTRQTIELRNSAFEWRARTGPVGMISIRDALMPGGGELEVKALGLIPIAREAASPALTRGELMRYLAEVAWGPDAILTNHELEWTDRDANTLAVAVGNTSVVLTLDGNGRISETFAPDRPRSISNGLVPTPWRGYFSDYRNIGGRMIPFIGNASWVIDGVEQVYGEFTLTDWRLVSSD